MELKEILGEELAGKVSASADELVKQIVTKLGSTKLILGDATTHVPKSEFNEKNEALKAAKELIAKNENDLKTLKDAAAGNVTLQTQITDLQRANKAAKEEADASQLRTKKTFALKEALMNAGVGDPEARNLLALKFDIEKMELDEAGVPKGFLDQLKPIKENKAFAGMFGTTVIVGQEHAGGESPDPALREYATNNPFSRSTKNLTTQIKIQKENPELAEKLKVTAVN